MQPTRPRSAEVDDPAFYDAHWRRTSTGDSPEILDKAALMTSLVPANVATIVDVGCGDGTLTHAFIDRWQVTAVDRSAVALEHLRCATVQASADDLSLPDASTDLLMSSEMLEHLPPEVLAGAAREFDRVARRWLLLAVPHAEVLRLRFGRWPGCGLEFHTHGHLHSFDAASLGALFPRFEVVSEHACGAPEGRSFAPVETLRQRLGRRWWLDSANPVDCPGCGLSPVPPMRRWPWHRALSKGLDALTALGNTMMSRQPQPYWLVLLLRRQGG